MKVEKSNVNKLNSGQTPGIVTGALFALLTIVSGSALAQSAADNIRPVSEVCMAGQPCVGQPASGGSMTSSSGSGASASASNSSANASSSGSSSTGGSAANTNTASSSAPADEEPADAQSDSAAATDVAAASSDVDAEAIYNRNCMACHMTGAAGAPKLDDDAAWEERLAKGMDAVMTNVYNGIGAMPARGLCMSCSDEDLRAVVDYMISQ
jgi:cytochrome c5